ncbi:hypothetical protein [Listeria newyorkensis]|uniref:hypothetical protein n=1 Tax=Listeria newyorkensis TaxID=1497681 RepID=UPI0010F74781|nr:hypothetical protein [Listeria newyorkensis]
MTGKKRKRRRIWWLLLYIVWMGTVTVPILVTESMQQNAWSMFFLTLPMYLFATWVLWWQWSGKYQTKKRSKS